MSNIITKALNFFQPHKYLLGPVTKDIKDKPSQSEISYDNSVIYQGKDFRKYNPDDLLWKKGLDIYKRMMHDDQVKAAVEFKIHSVSCKSYSFDVSNEPRQQEIADYFYEMIYNIRGSFTDILQNILTAIKFGFSISEIIPEFMEFNKRTMWGIRDIKTRDAATFYDGFEIDQHGNIISLVQQIENGKEIPISMDRVIHFVHQPNIDRHYGESDLRACYKNWWSKDILIKFQNIFLERFAGGFIMAKVTGDLGPTQKANLKNVIKNLSARLGIMIPSNVEIKTEQPKDTEAYERAIIQHDKAIAKSLLVPNLLGLSEQGDTGSYAQSKTHLDAFFLIDDAITKRLEECLNEQLLKSYALYNFGSKIFPRLKFDRFTKEQKIEISKTFLELIKGNGIRKSNTDEIYIRSLLDLPDMEEQEEEPKEDIQQSIEQTNEREEIEEIEQFIDRKLNPWELRINVKKYKESWDETDNKFSDDLNLHMGIIKKQLYVQIERLINDRPLRTLSLSEFKDLKISAKLVKQLQVIIGDNLQKALIDSHNLAYKELPKLFVDKIKRVIKPGKDINRADKFLKDKKFWITGIIEKDILDASQLVLANSIKYDKNLKQTLLALDEDVNLSSYLPIIDGAGRVINKAARLENIVRTNISEAINVGRKTVFEHPDIKGFIQAYQYSAILDDRVTDICETLDGRIQKDWGNYLPPNHYQCRSILVPITTIDEWNGKEDDIPSSVKPLKGFS